ncbi:MAG TPA: endopeptidase La [Bdellovibrionota bacterium]|nr:endopeptidase La [Bdellovibrionota bacterium]
MTESDNQNPSQATGAGAGGLILTDQTLPPNLFVLPINGPVVFPTLLAPLLVTQPRLVAMIEEAINRQRVIGLLLTRDTAEIKDETRPADLHDIGVAVKIIKRLRMPDGSVNLLVHSMKRFRAKRVLSDQPYLVVETEYLNDILEKSTEQDALTRTVIAHVKKLSEVNPFFTEEMRLAMINAPGPGTVADLVAFALSLPKADAQQFLEMLPVKARFEKLLVHLRKEQDLADVQRKINEDVNSKINKLQREFFLKEQMKSIRRELGMEEDGKEKSVRTFRERIESLQLPEEAKKSALEELSKFETLSENSPEYNVVRGYLETICSLPWSNETKDNLDLENARAVLNSEHYGLEKVKDRIIEFLAVRQLKPDPRGSIICLVGPPGVGKTSVGKSIAKTLGRKFYRFSLGGMRDEAEIKGHRRTYVGAMPGKVIQGLKRAGAKNAVLMLDEIDKLGQSFQGDPASALLEVLDPEQNHAFLDHYLDLPFDLSRVLFITTANTTANIPGPLLDRMEVIELPGYTLEEKEDIALRFVIPKELEANGLKPEHLRIEKAALRKMITDYAREPGLRTLQQLVGRIARKAAALIVSRRSTKGHRSRKTSKPIVIGAEELVNWLGPKRFYNEVAERITSPGVAVGLAWTPMGGDILFIEASDIPGTGNLKLTGQMGEVMTESASIAWSYVKRKISRELQLERQFFRSHDYHLHIPAGAIPKDGPSAGVTMATALYSLLSGRKAKHRLAMTGELSLVGKVLPVGGIKEKLLAARRSGIQTVVLPKLNQKDMAEVPEYALRGMTLHFVNHIEDVFALALEERQPTSKRMLRNGTFSRVLRSKKKTIGRTALKNYY